MRFKGLKSFTLGKSKEETEEENIEEGDITAAQITEMEEKINNRTKDLEDTTQLLQELNGTVEDSDEENPTRPHGPLSELSIDPEDDLKFDDIDVSTPVEEAGGDVKLVEIGAKDAAPAEPKDSDEDAKIFETKTEDIVLTEEATDIKLEDEGDIPLAGV